MELSTMKRVEHGYRCRLFIQFEINEVRMNERRKKRPFRKKERKKERKDHLERKKEGKKERKTI